MKLKIIIVTILLLLLLVLISVVFYINQNNQKSLPVNPPISETGEVNFCKEGIRGNDCIKCSCDSANDCKLVTSPYVISECAEPEAVAKSTSESCLDEVRNMAIQATCVVPEDYTPPEYEVVCLNNTCGKMVK